jgi:amino acid adenylation domain-containing protein
MTESQLLFYFGKQYQPEVRLYYEHVTTLFTVPPDLDRLHLQRAIQKLVDLSDALRSTFYEVAGVPERHLRDTIKVELPLVDLSAEPEPDAALATWAAERCDSEMDLTKQPFDTALVKLAPDRLMWFLKVHHLVSDAWSTALILRRTSELYHLSLQEQLDSAPALPAFQDYVDYENSLRRSARYRRAERFWHELLGKQAEQFDFYRRDGMPATTQTARLTVQLGADRTARVGQLAKAAGLTSPAVVLAAALFGYLRRISGQDLIRIGTPLANRPLQFRETIGLFMNASPLQVELAGEPTFVQLLRQVQLAFHQAARHQHHPVKNPAHEPVYDIYFNYQNVQLEGFDGTVGMTLLTTGQSNDRLALQVRNFTGTDEYELDFDFNVAFFEAHDQARTVDHYLNVLDAMLDDPQAHLAETVLLTPAEQHQLVQEFNRTARPYPLDIPLHEWIERQVARTPGLPAVRFEQQSLSYAELNARANQLARRLVAHGVTRDCLVGVHLERSLDLVVALLAVLKAGAAYLPLDPHYPAERLGFIIRDSGSSVVITTRELATEAIRQPGVRVMLAEAAESAEEAEGNLGLAVTSDQLAYVIYTSGSTGRPKAVQIEHRSICNRLLWMQETYRIGAADRVLQKTPFTFDVSVWEFFWPLMTGACLVVARPGGHQDPAYLIDTIRRQDITTVHFVPSMLRVFLDTPNASTCDCLERVFCSGEALPPDLVVRFHELIAASLFNLYGPTEAAVDVSAWACEPMSGLTTVPIGRPVANTQLYVLDRDGQLAPCGIAGELYIGGVQLARGYLGRPDLTEQRFPPTTRALNSRLYRTGDLVRQRVDGAIEFLGRLDSQVKLRGYRIELGEIEACLLGQPMVRDACVQLWNDHLVAYLVPAGPSFNESRVRAALAETLPHYMLPSFFVQLRALPTTSNGKLDRKALPAPEQAAAVSDAELPRTETEAILAQLWAELLGRDGIDIHSDFFTLGGHSLLAAKLVSMIQHRFGLQLPLATLLRASTVAALAAMVDGDAGVSSVDRRLVPIHDRGQLPPLFAFHPAGGEVIGYRGLAAKMGENRPLLGIQSRCLAGQTEHPSIAAMVTEYVAVIRHRQPYGPYHLLGWSMGGVVAVAAAAELENQGEQVAFLGLLDSHLGDGETDPLLAPAIALAGAGADMAVDHAVITELRSIIRDVEPEQRVQAAWRWARRRGLLPSGAALLPALERQAELATVHEQLLRTYQPPVLDCPITVWWASDRIHAGRIPDWGLHTHGNVIEESTPGNHFTMLQPPHVNQLAARLRTALDQLPLHGLTSKEKVKHHDDDSALPGKPLSPRSVQRTQAPLSVRAAELG